MLQKGSSESALVKIPHCWKSHVAAELCNTHLDFLWLFTESLEHAVSKDMELALAEFLSTIYLICFRNKLHARIIKIGVIHV